MISFIKGKKAVQICLALMYGQKIIKYMSEWSNGHILVPLRSVVEERQHRGRERLKDAGHVTQNVPL